MLIDGALEDLQGVKSASASYAHQVEDVEYDEANVSEEAILRAVQEVGYSAVAPLSDTRS
jgi:copper chaperone CopZ